RLVSPARAAVDVFWKGRSTLTDYTEKIALPADINVGLKSMRTHTLLSMLGNPRDCYTQQCEPVTNARLKARIARRNAGPFSVTGFDAAVDSLEQVLAEVRQVYPELYKQLGSMGMLCVRNIRGSTTSISRHSFGLAHD